MSGQGPYGLKAGVGRADITPPLGVELCGFGPFLERRARTVHAQLWARALALAQGDQRALVVSCELIGLSPALVAAIQQGLQAATGIDPSAVLLCATHTHSGPATLDLVGWGEPDPAYLAALPGRIIACGVEALRSLQPARVRYARVACPGIARNRVQDGPPRGEEDVLDPAWRPRNPALTDTDCHVLRLEAQDHVIGVVSSFACHPAVVCADGRAIHGDFCGIACARLEQEYPGAVALFLQGALGDINPCFAHQPEAPSLRAVEVIALRYLDALHRGMAQARELADSTLAVHRLERRFTRGQVARDAVMHRLEQHRQAVALRPDGPEAPMHRVHARSLERLLEAHQDAETWSPALPLQGLRLGPVALLGSPFEVFQAIRRRVSEAARSPHPVVLSLVNGAAGYAPDQRALALGGYATGLAVAIYGHAPYVHPEEELTAALLALDAALAGHGAAA